MNIKGLYMGYSVCRRKTSDSIMSSHNRVIRERWEEEPKPLTAKKNGDSKKGMQFDKIRNKSQAIWRFPFISMAKSFLFHVCSPMESCHYYPLLLLKHKFQNSHKALHFISFYFLQNWIQLLKALRSEVFSSLFFSFSISLEFGVFVCLCGCGFHLNGYDLKWIVFATELCDNK